MKTTIDEQPKKSRKKPIYAKWWVWVIGILILGGIGRAISGPDSSPEDAPMLSPADTETPEPTDTPRPEIKIDDDAVQASFDALIETGEGTIISIDYEKHDTYCRANIVVSDAWYASEEYEKERFAETIGDTVKKAIAVNSNITVDDVRIYFYDIAGKELANSRWIMGGYKIER